ncbi:hypothetical protein PHLGIDRAFT_128766 [Phlebiopsis gigantea 11061_1 CR5-6]|uniref:non-specific serine/threonine protein kinase n=1 Tax=Phlebiopsis gigantea (strain 11061_1 CR5-6) TaxID=745531 RepID=A0A0C3S8T9_PHLG1|nr:hypothetical protein PHLGIDRAFT_128766 [Phlebiopsis gigantea 11061_1 CR5-6]
MGNAQSLTRTSGALDSFVAELGNDVVYERSLGLARFLKTVKCRHKNGYLVVKIFIKPDPGLSLRKYHRRLKTERDALADIPNVYTYQSFVETDKAGYLVRQWVASSLYDRISTRPFLSNIEKKWLAYQLLTALRDARNRKISHGDLKTSNILITSWNWLLLSDFAPHKPALLPLDDPADFSFFFDTSGRRTCYIAPERFYTAEDNPEANKRREREREKEGEGRREGRVTEAMDCFSAGCVLAELFLEGTPLFSLSQLFKYRVGELNVDAQLTAIEDEGMRSLIRSMIVIDPTQRPTFDALLHTARGTVFPETFYSFLHNYVASINELSSPSPFTFPSHLSTATPVTATPTTAKPIVSNATQPGLSNSPDELGEPLPSDSDRRMERLWSDYESVEPYLLPTADSESMEDTVKEPVKIEYATPNVAGKPFQDIFPVELEIPNRDNTLLKGYGDGRKAAKEDGPALILLALLTANIRTCTLPSSKLRALDVCLALAPLLTDEAKLDRMVPYIVELLHDDASSVRAAAVRTLMQILMLVTVITPSNASIFPEYIVPALGHLIRDPEISVRCMYAQCVVALAETAVRYLDMGQALRAHGAYKIATVAGMVEGQDYDETHFEVSYDASMQDLQNAIQEQLSALLVDPSPVVKRAILHNISALCIFLGKQRTNDVLLSHMITYLNDRDWLLRFAFFDSIVDVAACAGGRSLEDYILPLMIQALSDVEETVVARVLASLRSLCELGLFQKMRIWELLSATLSFLYHPNIWIRQGAAAFIAAATKHLPPSDVWCILYPSLKYFLRSDLRDADERSLLLAMKPQLPRHIFDAAKAWAKGSDKSAFWRTQKIIRLDSPKNSLASVRQTSTSARSRSEEDEAQLMKLQQLGMTTTDENKLMAMRDFISKLARNIASFETRVRVEPEIDGLKASNTVELQKLGVVPQTVFLKASVDSSTTRYARPLVAQRAVSELIRSPLVGTPRSHRAMSADFSTGAGGAPFEDLRRRLAIINGSTTSLAVPQSTRDARSPTLPIADVFTSPSSSTAVSDVPLNRPPSPTESVASAANSSFRGAVHRLHIGSIDGQKALPALGSSKANATGLLESHPKLREGSPARSGRSSPVSATGTVRRLERPRISTAVPISTYDGQESGISNLLEHMYLENNRDLQADFGPRVHEGPIRRRNATRHSYMPRDGSNRRLETTLIANLSSHSDAITGLAVSPDHMFFVSASDDRTVKVWDTARLERNVTSKPRHTYGQHHAKVKAICFVEATHCFVSAAEDGSIHVVRVHVSGGQGQGGGLPKYGKLQAVREHRLEAPGQYVTCMTHYNTATSSNLLYGTTHSTISILDIRTTRVLQTMENPRHYGPITCICLDRKRAWVVCGTSTGVLSLWDLRFGILIKSWRADAAARRSTRIHHCTVHPTKGKGRWIVVAVESARDDATAGAEGSSRGMTTLVEVWDIEKTLLVETFTTRSVATSSSPLPDPQDAQTHIVDPSPAAAIAALVRARQEGTAAPYFLPSRRRASTSAAPADMDVPTPDVHALVLGAEFGGHGALHRSPMADLDDGTLSRGGGRGFMLCGSDDRRIRLWDLGKLERSTVLSGLEADSEKPTYSTAHAASGALSTYVETWLASPSAGQSNRPPQRLSLINHNQQNLLKAHQDTVTALVCIDSPFRGGIVSGDRAGVVKVWRVESVE